MGVKDSERRKTQEAGKRKLRKTGQQCVTTDSCGSCSCFGSWCWSCFPDFIIVVVAKVVEILRLLWFRLPLIQTENTRGVLHQVSDRQEGERVEAKQYNQDICLDCLFKIRSLESPFVEYVFMYPSFNHDTIITGCSLCKEREWKEFWRDKESESESCPNNFSQFFLSEAPIGSGVWGKTWFSQECFAVSHPLNPLIIPNCNPRSITKEYVTLVVVSHAKFKTTSVQKLNIISNSVFAVLSISIMALKGNSLLCRIFSPLNSYIFFPDVWKTLQVFILVQESNLVL